MFCSYFIMPSKGRNDNIYSKKVIHRFTHSLWIKKAEDYVGGRSPARNLVTELITVAESSPQQRLGLLIGLNQCVAQ